MLSTDTLSSEDMNTPFVNQWDLSLQQGLDPDWLEQIPPILWDRNSDIVTFNSSSPWRGSSEQGGSSDVIASSALDPNKPRNGTNNEGQWNLEHRMPQSAEAGLNPIATGSARAGVVAASTQVRAMQAAGVARAKLQEQVNVNARSEINSLANPRSAPVSRLVMTNGQTGGKTWQNRGSNPVRGNQSQKGSPARP
jgi:hypothetical protein